MKTIALDVHTEWSQLAAYNEAGETLLELKVATTAQELQRVIKGIPGPKRVVFEEGALSGMIRDALVDRVEELVSADTTRNALIARAEDANDENDTRRLAMLSRAGALHPVYVPPEPYRTWRSLVRYDASMARGVTGLKNRIKGLCRRHGVRYQGAGIFRGAKRAAVLKKMPTPAVAWQIESLYRRLDQIRRERVGLHRVLAGLGKNLPVLKRLQTIPGFGVLTARTFVAWIVDPLRFKSRKALSSYAGLGLGQGWTNWKPVGRARASKRGQRELKRILFTAARAATHGHNALARRYQARLQAGWDDRKAIRDIARTILFAACSIWITGKEYQDGRVKIPTLATR